jgi:uncharacterized protein
VIVIADAGPLIALAKVGGLEPLRQLYAPIFIAPAVYNEVITAGLLLGAADASLLNNEYQQGAFEVRAPTLAVLRIQALIGPGEEESIRLAIELKADWLLLDDFEANIASAEVSTKIQGTLGVLISAFRAGHLSREKAIEIIEAIKGRPDIWISADLCDRVIESLRAA